MSYSLNVTVGQTPPRQRKTPFWRAVARWGAIFGFGFFAAQFCTAGYFLLLAPPRYEARAHLLLQGDSGVVCAEAISGACGGRDVVATEIAVIASRANLEGVAAQLGGAVLDAAALERGLRVRRVDQSYVVSVGFVAGDPELSARVANAVADGYLGGVSVARRAAAARAGHWLSARLAALRGDLAEKERAVEALRERTAANGGCAAQGAGDESATCRALFELQREVVTTRGVYEAVLERVAALDDGAGDLWRDARIVSRAEAPMTRAAPGSEELLLVGGAIGLAGGAGALGGAGMGRAVIRRLRARRLRRTQRRPLLQDL